MTVGTLSLSIVLPALNEEDNIQGAIKEAAAAAREVAPAWEVIVVDDGSTDATAERVEACRHEHPNLQMVRFDRNRGYGAALRAGFSAARGELVFYTDSDRQFDPGCLRDVLPLPDAIDIVVGYRIGRRDPAPRRLLAWLYKQSIRLLFGIRLRDIDCSFKIFKRQVFETIPLESSDFFIDTEMVLRARLCGFRIAERAVPHYPRVAGRSSVRAGRILATLKTIVRMRLRLGRPVAWSSPPVCAADPPPLNTTDFNPPSSRRVSRTSAQGYPATDIPSSRPAHALTD